MGHCSWKKRGGYGEMFLCYRIVFTELYNWTQSKVTSSLHPYISNFSNVYIKISLPFTVWQLPLRFSE
jgi:hypothetical protein